MAALQEAQSEEHCSLALIRRSSRTAWRWVGAYERGLSGPLAMWAVCKCLSQRGITGAVGRQLNQEHEREARNAREAASESEEEEGEFAGADAEAACLAASLNGASLDVDVDSD